MCLYFFLFELVCEVFVFLFFRIWKKIPFSTDYHYSIKYFHCKQFFVKFFAYREKKCLCVIVFLQIGDILFA